MSAPRVLHDVSHAPRVPVHVWSRALSEETARQLQTLAEAPYLAGPIAAMPDAHVAEGVAVGTVFVTEHVVVPAALGGDLGCGMAAIPLELDARSLDRRRLERVLDALGGAIPVGDAVHRGRALRGPPRVLEAVDQLSTSTTKRALERLAERHLGTLGGGNHFLELDRDPENQVWLIVHSGSRGFGGAVAAHHKKVAEDEALRDGAPPRAHGYPPGLDVRRPTGQAYLADLAVALAFARENRDQMIARALEVLAEETGATAIADSRIDVEHNVVREEVHGGRRLLVHRKGATSARAGELGLVPGSMGTATYVVRGRGAEASYGSCSHGAGRVLTRSEARRKVRPEALERAMRRVVFDRRRLAALVEEAPEVYREIREVIEDQDDLVEPVLRLEPILVLKG